MCMGNNAPIFILGMPRCRTAWLSFCVSALGVDCSHEGLREHATFAEYAAELDERLAAGSAGDADPGLIFWLPKLLEHWPQARLAVITREESGGRAALAHAVPEERARLEQHWDGYLHAFRSACDRLRQSSTTVRFWAMEQLGQDAVVQDIMAWLTGRRPCAQWVRRKQRLRVTAEVDLAQCVVRPSVAEHPETKLQPMLTGLQHFDTRGLKVELYRSANFPLVAAWWQAHTGQALAEASLPPLGVLVSDEEGPCAAVWCYECFGVPVAELIYPVARPGLTLTQSSAAVCYGIAACVAAAGQGHEPRGNFRFFKVFAPRGATRALARLGFQPSATERVAMTLSL